jgi:cytochrome d ubiquinol oxidase subunit II
MFDYGTLRVIWWALLGILLIGFAVTDGFDLGLGASFRFIARTDQERRMLIASFEPFWEGNQVWLVLGAGAVFAAWPLLYATSFSGLYLAMLLLLLALILRPVGFAFRNKLVDPHWRNGWDWALTVGGAVPALLFGVAFGNLFLGIPFHFDFLQRPIYSGGFFNLLHPFALLAGVVSLSMMLLHGTTYAAMKVGEPLAARARKGAALGGALFIVSFALAHVWIRGHIPGYQIIGVMDHAGPSSPMSKNVTVIAGAWMANFQYWPWLWVAPAGAFLTCLGALIANFAKRPVAAFLLSGLTSAGTILTAGFALFPFLMPSSSDPNQSLTVWDASSSAVTLRIMLWATVIFIPIILLYTTWVFRALKGQVRLEDLIDPH